MSESLIYSKASNWVDRGAPPAPVIAQCLTFWFDRHGAEDIVGMVSADATDVAPDTSRVSRESKASSSRHGRGS